MIYTRLDVNRVLSEAERDIAQCEYEYMLATTVANILTPFEGKQLTKRLADIVEQALRPKGFYVHYWDSDKNNLELHIGHEGQNYKEYLTFRLGRRDENDRRFSLEKFKENTYFQSQAEADKLRERLPEIPALVERWNNALDELANIEGSFAQQEYYLRRIFSVNFR